MRRIFFLCSFLITPYGASAAQNIPPELIRYADVILHNDKIFTADRDDANFTIAESIAIRDGRILSVGKNADALRLGRPQTVESTSIRNC